MEENKTRIKNIYDLVSQLDEAGMDMTKIVASAMDIGREIGRRIGHAEADREKKERTRENVN